ncbi:hypothetical protein BJ912DRAFT_36265 [Pholiota molesta]|nr:hypothetical protein BJ912DRAFT_36265 [Pholiota molesta]
MSAFLAFRSAAFSVLRPQRVHRLAQSIPSFQTYATKHEMVQAARIRKLEKEREKELVKHEKPRFIPKVKVVAQHPKNSDIPHSVVQVMDANGVLNPTRQQLNRILETIDHQTHVVRLVTHEPPIVRILTHLEDKMNQLATKAEKKASKGSKRIESTIIQLTWLTADADYHHKIAKAKEELEKGSARVEILFKNKPRVRYPAREEMDEQMDQVTKALEEVGQEWREREVLRGIAKIFFQSRTQKQLKALPS